MASGVRWLAPICAVAIASCGGGTAATSGTGQTRSGDSQPGSTPSASIAQVPGGDWPTFDYNPQRTGSGPPDTAIRASNLDQLTRRVAMIDGIADSSAIELHAVDVGGRVRDLVAVTTSYGKTIAIDPATGRRLWEFVPPGVSSAPGDPHVTTASPVADPNRRSLYAASPNGVIYKLSVAGGHEVWARRITFDPRHEKIAAALNISGRFVVVVTGGYIGDIPPYDGHVVTILRRSGRIAHVWNSECSRRHRLIRASSCSVTNTDGGNAMWGRAGAVIEPGGHRILTTTGNGPFNGRTNWGDSVLELSADASRLLHSWTPANEAQLASSDGDLGSTSPALLPRYHGRLLAVQGGKAGELDLLDLAALNGTGGRAGPRLGGQVQVISSPRGGQVLTAPAVWTRRGRVMVFVGDDSGTAAYQLVGGGRHPRLRYAWQDGTPSTSPVVAGGLLYAYDEIHGQVVVRRPLSGTALRSLPVPGGHWNSPIVVGGRVILPTGSYHDSARTSTIEIYHLPGR